MSIILELEKNKDIIILKYISGISTVVIGKYFNCNPGMIYTLLKNNNVEIRTIKKFENNINDYDDIIIELFNNNKSCYAISKILKISKSTIIRRAKKLGLNTNDKQKTDKNNLLKNKNDMILELHGKGKKQSEIAKILGHSISSISRYFKKHNIDNNIWKYNVNELYFDKIDSEEKAYILGWFYSDGTVNKDGKMRIQILETDSYILEWIKNEMEYTGPLYKIPSRGNSKPQCCLCINRKKLADKLINLGCVPNKSNILKLPGFETVPENLFHHFLRGYFDGDGSISANLRSVNITSSVVFCEDLQKYFQNKNIESKLYLRNNSGMLYFTKKEFQKKFLDFIYQDAKIFLERKRNKYLEFLKTV